MADCGELIKTEYMDAVVITRLRSIASACGLGRNAFWALAKAFLADILFERHRELKVWIETYYLNEGLAVLVTSLLV